jgi:hypothetical protein
MATAKNTDVVEVYRTESTIVAQKIVDVILIPDGINAVVHDRSDRAFPGIGQPGGWFVAVPGLQREEALRLIGEAMDNGFIDDEEGELLVPEEEGD